MRNFFLAFRRSLSRGAVWLLILLCPVVCFMASRLLETEKTPTAGFYMNAEGKSAENIEAYLLKQNFVKYDEIDVLRELVREGELDCAVIFPEDLEVRLEKGDMEGCAVFIESPESFSPELFRSHAAAALFREYAPYISAKAFEGTELSREDVLAEYEKLFSEGYSFSFEVSSMEGQPPRLELRRSAIVKAASSLLICVLALCLCSDNYENSYKSMAMRLGRKKSLSAVLLPGALSCLLLAWVSGALSVLLAGMPELVLPVLIYSLLITALGLGLAGIMKKARYMYVLLALLVALTAALCPVYVDLSLFVPAIGTVRKILPCYWLWLAADSPLRWSAISIGAAIIVLAFYLLPPKLKPRR